MLSKGNVIFTKNTHEDDLTAVLKVLSAYDYLKLVERVDAYAEASGEERFLADKASEGKWEEPEFVALKKAAEKLKGNETAAGTLWGLLVFSVLFERQDKTWAVSKNYHQKTNEYTLVKE